MCVSHNHSKSPNVHSHSHSHTHSHSKQTIFLYIRMKKKQYHQTSSEFNQFVRMYASAFVSLLRFSFCNVFDFRYLMIRSNTRTSLKAKYLQIYTNMNISIAAFKIIIKQRCQFLYSSELL